MPTAACNGLTYRTELNPPRTLNSGSNPARVPGNCRFYANNIGANDVCGASAAASTVASVTTSNEGFYTLSIEGTATGNSYVILIQPTGSQTADTDCLAMRLTFNNTNPNGLKSPAACW